MFAAVTITASDLDASRRFYRTTLEAIGVSPEAWRELQLGEGDEVTTGLHVAFVTRSRDQVDAFWRAGVDAGYESDGDPTPTARRSRPRVRSNTWPTHI